MKNQYFSYSYPFSAVVGQEQAKKALIFVVINPQIGGALLVGEKGTAKSTLVRSLAKIIDQQVVNVPLHITEDRLVGSIHLQEAIQNGIKKFEPGLLQDADGQILYIDEVNLLSNQIVNVLLQVASLGMNYVEREGISFSHPVKTSFIGSMNPEEGLLKPQFLDKFGLYVEVKGEKDIEIREEIMRRRLDFEKDPKEFCKKWEKASEELAIKIQQAKRILPQVEINKESLYFAGNLVSSGKCAGHRGEIALVETARTIAAYEGRVMVMPKDIKEAAMFVLPHRIRESISLEEPMAEEVQQASTEEIEVSNCNGEIQTDSKVTNFEESVSETEAAEENNNKSMQQKKGEGEKEQVEEIQPLQEKLRLGEEKHKKNKLVGDGKRSKVRSNSKKGRYVKYRLPNQDMGDLALDATLRVAATQQHHRKRGEVLLNIQKEDIRIKVREKRVGATILFVVDASGSMGAKRRMGAVKGAILALLTEAYQKRDKVGLVAFREASVEVLLDITRSVDLAEKSLKVMATGGKTPLALGLSKAFELLKVEKIKNPGSLQYIVLVSDGKANIPFKTEDPFADAMAVGEKIRQEGITTMVMDTQSGYISYPFAKQLAEQMEGEYLKIHQLSKGHIENHVKKLVKI